MFKKKDIENLFSNLSEVYASLDEINQNHFNRYYKKFGNTLIVDKKIKTKKAPNKFIVFRQEFAKQHPEIKNPIELSKAASVAWKQQNLQ